MYAVLGYMLRKINEDMFEASTNANFTRKVTLYSGHDKNIVGLLQSLKIYDGHFPDFSSALIFELWLHDEQYYVKVREYKFETRRSYGISLIVD